MHLHEIAFDTRKGFIILKHGCTSFTEESCSMLLARIHRWKKGKSLLNKEQKLSSFHCKTYRGNNKSPLCSEPFGHKTHFITFTTSLAFCLVFLTDGKGNGNPRQSSCLENSMDGGTWWATVHGVAKSWTWWNNFTFMKVKKIQVVGCLGAWSR